MANDTRLVRLKPYNKKKSHLLRRFTYRGIRFQEGRGWMRVREEIADYLAKVHQIPSDDDSPPAFDVCTESEAKAIDVQEAKDARKALPAEEAKDVAEARPQEQSASAEGEDGDEETPPTGDLTTAELPRNQKPAKAKRSRKSA